jgi:8-oxo-dGTP pyrophosphatase MutT (NUDIX family)
MCDVHFVHKASGKKIKNHFYWENVTWKKCKCGLVHSNRSIPPEFWKRKWVKKAKREKVGIMVIKGDNIWVTQSYNKCFGFPKGEKEEGETDKETCVREFKEETGSTITQEELSDDLKIVTRVRDIKYTFYILYVNSDYEINTLPEDDVEITTFGWKKLSNIFEIHLSKAIRKTLKIYFNRYKKNNDL